jgi:thiopeptide-type bacteriocin biosynthesis protein
MQRDFCLGSQWLYYKIYTGVKTTDYILLEKLEPIISNLKNERIIQKWFFIRYRDPDEHFRIRFFVNDPDNLLNIIQAFYPVFNELLEKNLVWKIQTDTYKRELERYGVATMIDSEFIFWKDTEMILQYLEIKPYFSQDEISILFSLYSIDSFLNSFQLSNQDKLSLLDNLQISFKKEFEIQKEQKKEMDRSYRLLYPQIKLLFSNSNEFPEIVAIVNNKSHEIQFTILKIQSEIEIPLFAFLSSHIHMMLNRQYTSKQRMYELIIYDYLFKYYKTLNYKR